MKRLVISLLISWPLFYGVAHGQTAPVVWSCQTNCSATSNTYNDGAFRALIPKPVYVAATTGTNTNCAVNWWNTSGAVRWRLTSTIAGNSCVSIRTGNVESFAAASTLWPATPPPPPVDCVVGEWSDWTAGEWGQCRNRTQSRVETRSRVVVTPASNGGNQCPVLTETRTASQPCSLSPPCFPESKADVDNHVAWEPLTLANWTLKYQAKAVWFCESPDGPRKQKWVFGLDAVATNARKKLDGLLNWDDVRDACEASCEAYEDLPEALRTELDAYAAGVTVEQTGTLP